MSKKKSILLTFVLLLVGGLTTFATAAPNGETGNEDYWSNFAASTFASQDESAKTLSISTPEELALLAKNVNSGTSYAEYTITISGTLDMSEHYWIPINARNGQLSGSIIQGSNTAVISNLKIDKAVYTDNYNYYAGFIAQTVGNLTVKDLTFSGAVSVDNGSGVATVLGLTYGNVLFENVKVVSSTVSAETKAGALVGFTGGDGITVTVKDCTLDKVTVTAVYSYALMVGLVNTRDHVVFKGNCSATNSRAVIDETAATTNFPTRKIIREYTYGVNDSKLWAIGVQDAWAECRTSPSPTMTIDNVDYTIMGDIFYHANNVIVDVCAVAKIGNEEYRTLADAIAAVKNGETITMIADEVLKKGQTITLENNEQFTLDLNGKTISIAETGFDFTANGTNVALRNGVPVRFAIVVNGNGTLNICDNSTDQSGKIETKNNSYGTTKTILVDGNATVNLNSGTITADYAPFYIVGYTGTAAITDPTSVPKPSLNVNGGTIEGQELGIGIKGNTAMLKVTGGEIIGTNSYGISTNGTQDWYDGGKFAIEITGGTIKSTKGTAMYLPAEGPTVITGGTLEGAEGIAVKGGILSISGDAIVMATGEQSEPASAFSGYTQTGSCIYIEDTYSDHKPIVNISGGKFSSVNNKAVEYFTTKTGDAPDKGKLTVYAGLYDDESAKDYLADGKTIIVNTDETTKTDYPHAVVPLTNEVQVAPDLEITSNDEEHPLTQEEQTKAETAVNEAIEDMAENTEVTNLPDNNNYAVESGVVGEGQSVGINVEFTGTKVSVATESQTTTVTLKELTFDVTPYVVKTVGEGEEKKSVAVKKIENDQITAPMIFRLPIPSSVTDNYAHVKHYLSETETEDMGLKEIKSTTTDKSKTCKYIEITTTSFSKFEAILKSVSEPNTLYYYAGNDTKVEGTDATPSAFSTAQETNKNAIAFVSEEYADWAETQTNVVVDYVEGETNGNRYVCPKFVLTDLEDFYSPVDFKALEGSYTRTNTQGLNSVCLPFAITTENVNNGKIGRYKSSEIKDDKTGTISFDFVESVDAGVPCIVDCEDNKDWTITFDDTEIKSAPVNNEPMKGSYVENVIGVNFFKVSSDGTKFVNTVEGSKVFPFRAYLDLITQTGAKELTIEWNDGSTTGINTIESKHIDNIIYDLTGRKVNNTVKGSVYIMNGKKYIK